MKTHKHHVVPRHQGGTDDPSNKTSINFIDHAELHAVRFLNGEDTRFDFRHEGWAFLSVELRMAVLSRTSELCQGNGGRFGNVSNDLPHPMTGLSWWTDGQTSVAAAVSPGENWVLGRTWNPEWNPEVLRGELSGRFGRRWFTNGTETISSGVCPEGWWPGMDAEMSASHGVPGRPKTEEWKQMRSKETQGEKNPAWGRRWVTDGVTNLFLGPDDETPENFTHGRTLK